MPKIHCLVTVVRIRETSKATLCLGQLQYFCKRNGNYLVWINTGVLGPNTVTCTGRSVRKERGPLADPCCTALTRPLFNYN